MEIVHSFFLNPGTVSLTSVSPASSAQAFADRKSGPKPAPDFLQKSSYPEDDRSAHDDAAGQVPLQRTEKEVPLISEFVKRADLNTLSPELARNSGTRLFSVLLLY